MANILCLSADHFMQPGFPISQASSTRLRLLSADRHSSLRGYSVFNEFSKKLKGEADDIGRGRLIDPPFHNGCWCGGMWWDGKGTQVGGVEAMQAIENVLTSYLAGNPAEEAAAQFPHAEEFIRRAYEWLGPRGELTRIRR